MENYVKILLSFHSDILDEWTVETLWAEVMDEEKGHYKLDNIPFYASVACDDIVVAEYDESQKNLVYKKTLQYSGNSTIQVVLLDKNKEVNEIRKVFQALGCESEKYAEGYFVINVPSNLDYTPVKALLEQLSADTIIDYAEPCLGFNHQY